MGEEWIEHERLPLHATAAVQESQFGSSTVNAVTLLTF